jgi:hypothetical protein
MRGRQIVRQILIGEAEYKKLVRIRYGFGAKVDILKQSEVHRISGKEELIEREKPQGSKHPAALTGDFARALVNRQQRDQSSADRPC